MPVKDSYLWEENETNDFVHEDDDVLYQVSKRIKTSRKEISYQRQSQVLRDLESTRKQEVRLASIVVEQLNYISYKCLVTYGSLIQYYLSCRA